MVTVRAIRNALTLVPLAVPFLGGVPIASADTAPTFVSGELIVTFDATAPKLSRAQAHAEIGATVKETTARPGVELVTLPDGLSIEDATTLYLQKVGVVTAEPNAWGEGGFVPNDTQYGNQWHHRNTGQTGGSAGADIESEAGWDTSRGNAAVVVAVLDSGIDSDHPEFTGRIVAGFDFVNEDADPEDDHSHGTWAAGSLGANANNSFSGAGVDHFCQIMPVKVLNSSNAGTTFDLIQGVDFAAAQGVDVISMSLINYPFNTALDNAMRDAKLGGAILIACAGNGGIGNADVSWPGASNHTISIGATTHTDARASFSGTGNQLEFVAPGQNVRTTRPFTAADAVDIVSGCSFATPIVAGMVSILRGLEPGILTNRTRDILEAAALDQVGAPGEDTPGFDVFMGWGRLSLDRVLDAYLAVVSTPELVAQLDEMELFVRPNPVRDESTLEFVLPLDARVNVSIFDVTGRRVRSLASGVRNEGAQRLTWDGRDDAGHATAPGVYFARVTANDRVIQQKITRVR